MRLPLRALLDPAAERLDLGRAQPGLAARDVRHAPELVRVRDALEERARLGMAGDDGHVAGGQRTRRHLLQVKPQLFLAPIAVGTVAGVAVLGQDGAHVPVERDAGGRARRARRAILRRRRQRLDHGALRPGRTLVDPPLHGLDLRRRESAAPPRHALVGIGRDQELVQEAPLSVTRHDHRTRVSAFVQPLACVEPKVALGLARAVAAHAGGREDGLDIAREIDGGTGRRRTRRRRARRGQRSAHARGEDDGAGGAQDPGNPHHV